MTPTCEQFRDQVLELAYGELDGELAQSLRAHAEQCAACGTELRQINALRNVAGQVAPVEVPTHFDDAILALAKSRAEQMAVNSRNSSGPQAEVPATGTLIAFIRKPQFAAVALAAALMVGFLVHRNADPAKMMMEPDGGAPFVGPATNASDESAPRSAMEAKAPPELQKSAPAMELREEAGTMDTAARSIEKKKDRAALKPPPRPAANPANHLASAETTADADHALLGSGAPAKRESTVFHSSSGPPPAPLAAKSRSAAPSAEMAAMEAESIDALSDDDAGGLFDVAMAQYRSGNCNAAIDGFRKAIDSGEARGEWAASALHHIARCEKRSGSCGRALISYEALLRTYPGYAAREDALWETATCHRRLGHLDRARSLLNELAADPAWSGRVQGELNAMEE